MNFSKKRQILATVAIGTFMSALDSSVVNIALPRMSAYFHAPLAAIEWAVLSYLLVISSLLLVYGRLGDIYGHKKIYLLGFLIFTAGSLFCGLAPTVLILVIFRGIQALGAGMLMATGPAIITDNVLPQERGKALSVSAVSVAVALSVGPVLGGILTSAFGWQSIFYINLPVGIFGFWWGRLTLPASKEVSSKQPFDFVGAGLLFAGLISILLPLSLVEEYGWNNGWIIGFILAGIGILVGFIVWEKRNQAPMFDVDLFRNRLFAMSNITALLNFVAQFTIILVVPFYLQGLRGLSPAQAGLFMIVMPVTTMLISPISGTLSDRMDTRYLSSAGMAVIVFGMWMLSNLKADSSSLFMVAGLIITGLGIGWFQTPNNSAIMGSVPPFKRGVASGMLATMRNVGMVIGVALSGALFTSSQNWLTAQGKTQGLGGVQLTNFAFTGALHTTYIVGAFIALVGVATSLSKGPTRSE
ncbi:MAG TPA: MFS transporter [Bacillota bacterium]|nr:MFS transporter [Bacillota bacterium]